MAAAWPTTKPTYPLDEQPYKPALRTEFEAGYVQSRARATRTRRRWTLVWRGMSESEYGSLVEYFTANQGTTFTWTHPVTSASHTVRFSEDQIHGVAATPTRRDVTVRIEEA